MPRAEKCFARATSLMGYKLTIGWLLWWLASARMRKKPTRLQILLVSTRCYHVANEFGLIYPERQAS